MGVSYFENISLSKYIPFKYLQRNDIISVSKSGVLLDESFDKYNVISNWLHLYTLEKDKVKQIYDFSGIDSSRCLLINSKSKEEWSYSQNKYVEVRKGDKFYYSLNSYLEGDNLVAYVCIDTFDKNRKPLTWKYISQDIKKVNNWIKIENRFCINEDIPYVRLRLSGKGRGQFRFDNIVFKRAHLKNNQSKEINPYQVIVTM